jgi:hypothetical protein
MKILSTVLFEFFRPRLLPLVYDTDGGDGLSRSFSKEEGNDARQVQNEKSYITEPSTKSASD